MLSLLSILAALSVVSTATLRSRGRLEEGVMRLEAMLRLARAESANSQRRIKLAFEEDGNRPRLLVEPDPLGQPNVFVPYKGGLWDSYTEDDIIRPARCILTGPSAYRTLAMESMGQEDLPDCQEVVFLPDGSSDSAEIHLSAADTADVRTGVITLNGLTGTIESKIVSSGEYEEMK